jgi:digeranylgeranylglycerophospholipid reductase
VVIGADPSGSSASAEMAERGLSVLMIEKDEFPGKSKVCGGGIAEPFIEDLDLEPFVIEKEISGNIFFFPWMVINGGRANARSVSVQRKVFDNYLAQRAVRAGVKMSCLTLATGISTEIDKIRVYLRKMNTGERMSVIADLVIFADGPTSLAHRSFGLGFSKDRDKTGLGAIYELEWKSNPLDCCEFYFDREVSPWGYGWIIPKRNVVNVGVGCLLSKLQRNIRQHLDYLVNKHPIASKKLASRKVLRFGVALIPFAPAQKTVGHRILIVGDAAGMVDPLMGSGIGYAIHTGRTAGWIAAKAFRKSDFSEDFLRHEWMHEWEKTKDSRFLQFEYVISRIMLALSSVDREACIRMWAYWSAIGRLLNRT